MTHSVFIILDKKYEDDLQKYIIDIFDKLRTDGHVGVSGIVVGSNRIYILEMEFDEYSNFADYESNYKKISEIRDEFKCPYVVHIETTDIKLVNKVLLSLDYNGRAYVDNDKWKIFPIEDVKNMILNNKDWYNVYGKELPKDR